ncbi:MULTISPECIES: DNA/RNA non-specific endonuclease [unclassified Streptomyces]|uniref:DNA/RNA non-specific endonuclease n=1 Tax=unclassified Streptomyces TaxID=2593676 RepID=UPI003828149A
MRPSARIPRVRRVLLSLLAVTALGATTTATAPGPKPPGAQEQPGHQVGRIDPAALPDLPALTTTRPFRAASGEHCEPTRSGSRERRAGAVEACVSIGPAAPRPTGRRALAAAPSTTSALAAGDSANCAITAPGTWKFNRFGYCVSGLTVLYVLRDGNGKQIGTGTLDVTTSALLPAEGTAWTEHVTVTMTGATGAVTSLSAKFRAACSAGCRTTKRAPWYGGTLIKGDARNGRVAYDSSPAAGTKVEFTTSYELYVTSPGAQITDPSASWSNPEQIRCDDDVRDLGSTGTPSPGCVVPSVMPVVGIDGTSGAAAAGYLWAQKNLSDGWGLDKPLTRAKSGMADRTRRTCGGSQPFREMTDFVATDSCGAFPFAATHEGGTDGALCAEIIPNGTGGGWNIHRLGDADPSRPCVRAHVPLADNQSAEAQLSEGFVKQRVLEAERFTVNITSSTAHRQGACLQNPPVGSLPNSNGWILNTTEPVPHVNKTTTPVGPAGSRPTVAQACLGKNVDEGSTAVGDITGWQDAELFRDKHAPTTGLARCHLIANILGGKGRVLDGGQENLVPCWQYGMNTGTPSMRAYETAAQKMVKEDANFGANDAIFYQVTPVYRDASSTIPLGVTMTATVQRPDGTSQPLFSDQYVPNTRGNTGKDNLGN